MKYSEKKLDDRREINELFAAWLEPYTHDVIVHVISHMDEIIENEMAMLMLRELKVREEKERQDYSHSIRNMMDHPEDFLIYDPHNHILEHSKSYRDVLYDLYIRKEG